MSGVVLRCPTCGTTQVKPGECEACFEGTVRYFCDNHTPGLWLDAPACKVCGATLGTPAPKAPERSRRVDATVPDHSRRSPAREVEIEDAPPMPSSLRDWMTRLSAERERLRPDIAERPLPAPEPESPGGAPFLRGCFVRLLLLVLLCVVLAVAGLFALLGGIFR